MYYKITGKLHGIFLMIYNSLSETLGEVTILFGLKIKIDPVIQNPLQLLRHL